MFVPSSETILTSVDDCRGLGGQGGGEKISKSVYKPGGTGELSFFFGLRHLGSLKTKTGYSEKCRSEKKKFAVGARANKRTGALCLRLPRAQFITLLKMFPAEEEKIAHAALATFDTQPARRQVTARMCKVIKAYFL